MKLEQRNGGQTVDTEIGERWVILAFFVGVVAYLIAEAIGLVKQP